MKSLIPLTLLVAVAAFVGCSQESVTATATSGDEQNATSVATVNERCPVMGGEVTDEGGQVEWNDTTVGFCCPECSEKFETMSDDEKTKALAKADKEHKDHDHEDHKG